jgi:hypothetical protein
MTFTSARMSWRVEASSSATSCGVIWSAARAIVSATSRSRIFASAIASASAPSTRAW